VNAQPKSCDFVLEPADNLRLANLCGPFDRHLGQLEERLGVEINNRGGKFRIIGDDRDSIELARRIILQLYDVTQREVVTPAGVHLALQQAGGIDDEVVLPVQKVGQGSITISTRHKQIKARNPNQAHYLRNIQNHDINFGIGPAGTGKTYLAVACAVEALEKERVQRLILTRPAVEAGERLGFLPGDLAQKIDPYLRPLYDALYEMLGFERVAKLIERQVIEIAPLAYMRGRTLNDAFVILDEAQNTTVEQMKMFLTRIGFGSIAVVTGDVTQVDLPRGKLSGLRHVTEVLCDVEGLSYTFFKAKDVVRHPLVQRIVSAYDDHDLAEAAQKKMAE